MTTPALSRASIFLLPALLPCAASVGEVPAPYPISPEVLSTVQRIVVPDALPADRATIYPYEVAQYAQNGYGDWQYGAGHDYGRVLTLMPAGYTGAGVVTERRLIHFFTISDIHIDDEETPCQGIYGGYLGGNSSGYSPTEMLTTQVLDAAVQTINALHARKGFDFGMSLGDNTNGDQYNELRWFIDVMDGETIVPDSGVKDDPVPGPSNDFQDAFSAQGLDKSIPWYQVIGNHDDFVWLGTYPIDEYLRTFYTGSDILLWGDPLHDGISSRTAYMGAMDGSKPYGDIIGTGPVANFPDGAPQVVADPDRRPLSGSEWMGEFFTTDSFPKGHGFSADNVRDGFACYSFVPKSDIPIKVIVLDDTQELAAYQMFSQGYLNRKRYDWLVSELDAGQKNNQLMIIAAHIPLDLIGFNYLSQPSTSYVTAAALKTKLSAYPNLILWVSGHRHRNAVTAHPSTDPAHSGAEYGFWEVETGSLRDFPQEFRTFDIAKNSDGTISIVIRDYDPAVADGSLAALSRDYSVAIQQFYSVSTDPLTTGPYNAELVKALSPAMQTALASAGEPARGAKWSRDWGWVDDTYFPWVYSYNAGNWFYLYSGDLNAENDDGYWLFYYTADFSGNGWGYVWPGSGWWCLPGGNAAAASWRVFADPLP